MARQLTIQDYLIMHVEDEKKLAEANKEIEKLKEEIRLLNSENLELKHKYEKLENALHLIRHATNNTDIVWNYDE